MAQMCQVNYIFLNQSERPTQTENYLSLMIALAQQLVSGTYKIQTEPLILITLKSFVLNLHN